LRPKKLNQRCEPFTAGVNRTSTRTSRLARKRGRTTMSKIGMGSLSSKRIAPIAIPAKIICFHQWFSVLLCCPMVVVLAVKIATQPIQIKISKRTARFQSNFLRLNISLRSEFPCVVLVLELEIPWQRAFQVL